MEDSGLFRFGSNVRRLREALGLSQERLGADARLDRSYIGGIERGERNPSLSTIFRLASTLGVPPHQLFEGIGKDTTKPDTPSGMTVVETNGDLVISFKYDRFDAEYHLPGATRAQYSELLGFMRDGLTDAKAKSDVVSSSFIRAVHMWPEANPSDLWTFLINRAYCDRSNHPHANERLNLEQSWKRTSGWALEQVLIAHYGPFLSDHGIIVRISSKSEKSSFLGAIDDSRIVPDKADVLILHRSDDSLQLVGVVHVKASIAERRTDDVPMSQALIDAGYLSVFWTMDSKSFPSSHPTNRGEFGDAEEDSISDKRRDFEEHGHFSVCFSYNKNTVPTRDDSDVLSRIFVCDFTNPDDRFARFLIDAVSQYLAR